MMTLMRSVTIGSSIALLAAAILGGQGQSRSAAVGDGDPIAIIVSDEAGTLLNSENCGRISIIDTDRGELLYQDQPHDPVFDLVVGKDLQQVIGSPGFSNSTVASRWLRTGAAWDQWQYQSLLPPPNSASFGHLLQFAMGSNDELYSQIMGSASDLRNLALFDLSELDRVASAIGLPSARKVGFAPSGASGAIFTTRNADVVHALGHLGRLSTIDGKSLEPIVPEVSYDPAIPDPGLASALARLGYTSTGQILFSDISLDERFIVTNRWNASSINVIDLQRRTSRTVSAGAGVTMTGGVAFNHGPINHGLLAIRTLNQVIVYRFFPEGSLQEVGRHPVPPLSHFTKSEYGVVPGDLAWSARGDHLIVATNDGSVDLMLIEVSDCGSKLRASAEFALCPGDKNQVQDIWTANKSLSTLPVNASACPMPDIRATATLLPPFVPSPTPIATALAGKAIDQRQEEKVVVFEGSRSVNERGCGALAYFEIGSGRLQYRSPALFEVGRVASDIVTSAFFLGPASEEMPNLRLIAQDYRTDERFGGRWRQSTISTSVGSLYPFGGLSLLWADTHLLIAYQAEGSAVASLGLFDRVWLDSPKLAAPIATVQVPTGVPASIVLEKFAREDAIMRYGGRAWIVTDLGQVWRLDIREMEEMVLEGPILSLGPRRPTPGDHGPAARRIHAELSWDERYLLVSGWGEGTVSSIDLETGLVRDFPFGRAITMTGQIATNRGWEHEGLIAVHAGDHVLLLAVGTDGLLVELARQAIPPPRNAAGDPEPGYLAWGTNGETLIVSLDQDEDEFAVFGIEQCGLRLRKLYTVGSCPDGGRGNAGGPIFTNNRFFLPPEDHESRCPVGLPPPTPIQPEPTAWPLLLPWLER